MKWHPDKNKENQKHAEEMFKEISRAYGILNDRTFRFLRPCRRRPPPALPRKRVTDTRGNWFRAQRRSGLCMTSLGWTG